jgi:hypothetical protein
LPRNIDCAESLRQRGEALYRSRRVAAAERAFAAAAAASGDAAAFAERLWMCAMLQGDFERAWEISDDVLRRRGDRGAAHLPRHLRWVWDGRPFAGRDVLVSCNHGLGDTLQFIRFVPRLAEFARSVAVEAQPELLPLLAGMPAVTQLMPLGAARPASYVAMELMELPHALRVTLASLPRRVPYLGPACRGGHAAAGSGLTVGLVWAAGEWRRERSIPLRLFEPLAALPAVQLVSLQQGDAASELEGSPLKHRIAQPLAGTTSVVSTFELVRRLDLILTVDTMMAHLAGAAAAPVWVLLDAEADWRWMVDRSDSPWYPTMRLFRQRRAGDWGSVLAEVAQALSAPRPLVGARR